MKALGFSYLKLFTVLHTGNAEMGIVDQEACCKAWAYLQFLHFFVKAIMMFLALSLQGSDFCMIITTINLSQVLYLYLSCLIW